MREPRRSWKDARGATVIEYGLICGLIFLALVGGVSHFGRSLTDLLYNVATRSSNHL